ncbi:MAG: hypothetical protein KH230_15640 [Enterocloster asparagiformis]|nr:hypothetical protein [Enterocloster asparagiformis]
MREIGIIIDRVGDCLSPNQIAGRIGRLAGMESARRREALLRKLLRLLLVLCEVSLILNMASCGGSAYNGFQLIRRTVMFEIKREYEWGALGLTFISVMSLAALVVLAVRRAPFRTLCWMTALNMLFAVGAVGFYKINEMFSSGYGIVHMLYGAYAVAVLYVAVFVTAFFGRAYETALGIGREEREYRHRLERNAVMAPFVLAQIFLLLLMLWRVRPRSLETKIMVLVVLAIAVLLLLLTLCRSRYAGSISAAEAIGLFYMGYATAANGRKFGWMFTVEIVIVFALSIWIMVRLNSRAGTEMAGARLGRPERLVHAKQPIRPARPAHQEQPGRPARPTHQEQPGRPMRPARQEQPGRPVRPAHPEQPGRPVRPARPEQPGRPVRPAYPEQPGRSERPARPVNPARPKQPVCPAPPCRPTSPAPSQTAPAGRVPAPSRPSMAESAAGTSPSALRGQGAQPIRPARPAAEVKSRFCTECGAKLDGDSRFCPGCGKKRS